MNIDLKEKKILPALYDKKDLADFIEDCRKTAYCGEKLGEQFVCAENLLSYNKSFSEGLSQFIDRSNKEKITFQDKLKDYLRIKGLKDTDVYKPLGMNEKAFNKIKNQDPDKSISFDMSVMIAYGLHLSFKEMTEMISLAGKSLRRDSVRDCIVQYFFTKEIYNIDSLNSALEEYGEKIFLKVKDDKLE